MNQEPLTLYKLIVLYLLDQVTFPLSKTQIGDFILEKEYTSFLTLQQVLNEVHQYLGQGLRPLGKGTLYPLPQEPN